MANDDSEFIPDEDSIGFVETQQVTLFEAPNELCLESGVRLGPIDIAYETYGTLSPEKDNAIFVCHALTGDAHVAGWHAGETEPSLHSFFFFFGRPAEEKKNKA